MTKRRRPLTFENALTTVAALIGWDEVARICGTQERACRNWSDPDTRQEIRIGAAQKLDVAFHAAGGKGTPFLTCFSANVEAAQLAAVPGREALLASAGRVAREAGEAVSAAVTAALPGASAADFYLGEREIEEGIAALTNMLAALRARQAHADAGTDLVTEGPS